MLGGLGVQCHGLTLICLIFSSLLVNAVILLLNCLVLVFDLCVHFLSLTCYFLYLNFIWTFI